MITIINRILRDRFIGFVSYCLGGVILILMYIVLLPSVQQSQAQVLEMMKNMPESILKVFGMNGVDLNSLESLLAMKHYNLVWPLLLIFFIVSFAATTIAGEIENRTIEIALSSAKSRVEIFFGKYLAGIIYTILFVVITTLSVIPIAKAFNYEYQWENYFTLMYLSLCLAFAVYSLSFLFSSFSSYRSKVFTISAALYVTMYVVFILTTLKDSLANFKYLSFFYYFNSSDALIFNKLSHLSLVVFLVIGLISTVAALIIFIERDIAV